MDNGGFRCSHCASAHAEEDGGECSVSGFVRNFNKGAIFITNSPTKNIRFGSCNDAEEEDNKKTREIFGSGADYWEWSNTSGR